MRCLVTILFLIAMRTLAAAPTTLSDDALLKIRFDQKIGAQVSPDLVFHDEKGNPVRIGNYFGKRPIVLIAGYYGCPMLCSLVLNGATESFRGLKDTVGQQFDVIFVSIDPAETSQLAAEKKKNYLRAYGRPGSDSGWHFLVGDSATIQRFADEIGYRFAYDPATRQFAHPSGFIVLTSAGKITRYFSGITFSASDLDITLHDAAAGKTETSSQSVPLLCFQYSPSKYGKAVMAAVRITSGVTVLALGALLVTLPRRKPGRRP
ncbi:MAG TPA: SCO family protein [Desulfuromonadaceae bacterium]|nr:SCO family protein [Desulfuromonadaceae bacterium]